MRSTILMLFAMGGTALAADSAILGYDDAASATQRETEALYDASIDTAEMDGWLRRMSAKPHHVGSPGSKENAEFIAGLFESWGFDVEIAEYRILLPTPNVREIELVAPTQFTATLREDSLEEDPSTFVRDDLLAPYNAFSVDGEVEGELVFVNYGIPEDYETLERYGIEVTGRIAIAKYGRSWRGIKPKLAAEKGAIATIMYSDPADDGYGAGDAYPKGPFKHGSGHAQCAATAPQRRTDNHQHSGTADLTTRCAAIAGRTRWRGRAGRMAGRPADHLPHRSRPGAGAHEGPLQLGHGDGV